MSKPLTGDQNPFRIDTKQRRRAFERAAQTYDSVAVLQSEVGDRLLQRLDLIKCTPKTVIDVGAGTGKAVRALGKRYRGARILALDIALPMLQLTRTRAGWIRRPAVLCADAEALPLADASIELIFSNLTLQWCNDLELALREFRRVLAPGGLAVFTTLGPDTLRELRDSWSKVDDYTHVNHFTDMHDIGDALLRVGFADPVMDMEMMSLTYPDVMQLMRELKLIGAQNKTLGRPPGLTGKDRLGRLIKAYEALRTAQGVIPASYEVVFGHAWALDRKLPSDASPGLKEVPISLEQLRKR
ncbi:MAG: malonyl-ACP O-methyltransferase BioC [Pseudomonadota bacterium]